MMGHRFYSSSVSRGAPPPRLAKAVGTPRGSLFFYTGPFGKSKWPGMAGHCCTIKVPFESSTFINLKQSMDLKAGNGTLPERIIKTADLQLLPHRCSSKEGFS